MTVPPDFADLAGVDPVALVQASDAASFCVTVHPTEYERPSPTARPVRDHFEPSLKLDSILVKPERLVHWYGRHGFELVTAGEAERYGIDCGGTRVAMLRNPRGIDGRG
ncbi:hypothetical protein [Mycobacteroides abscessus]|uniref:hypothetical protein n=1 Tax=Mycobacteroides abscessus TaxID=36809 RepID=UPI001054A041|nr:hypothetical protein [Mycobacteroides abscessus]